MSSFKKHFYICLALGLGLRFCCVTFAWGPQGLDDYLDNIIPAWKYLVGQDPGLHDYRSPLFMWLLSVWLRIGNLFSVEHAVSQIRWIYSLLAVLSISGLYAVQSLEKYKSNTQVHIVWMYLIAAHGILPFASTRAFMESFVMAPVLFANVQLYLSFTEKQKNKYRYILGFITLGVCSLIRFQIGIIYIAWGAILLIKRQRQSFLFSILFGVGLLFLEVLIDKAYNRQALQTLQAYIQFNSHQQNAGIMPWYNTWIAWLGFLFFPFSFIYLRTWIIVFKKYIYLFTPTLVYILVHSLNPHKEERYLYPVLFLSCLLLAEVWYLNVSKRRTKYFFNPIILLISASILFMSCFINSQASLVQPMAEVDFLNKKTALIDLEKSQIREWMSPFFLRQGSCYFNSWPVSLQEFAAIVVISNKENELNFVNKKFICSDIKNAQSLSDKLLAHLDPKINSRRQISFYIVCD